MQKLILPIQDFKPTAGYKNAKYKSYWGYVHYGVDCGSPSKNRKLYGLGEGTVKAVGLDGLNGKTTGTGSGCGYCLVIEYRDCYNWYTGRTYNLTVTYMHMAEMPKVKAGQAVHKTTYLGDYGNTGANTSGPHLHIQMDMDTTYYLYCCGLSAKGHNLLKKGTYDSTLNPAYFLHIGAGQSITVPASAWYDRTDFTMIPKATETKKAEATTETKKGVTTSGGGIEVK